MGTDANIQRLHKLHTAHEDNRIATREGEPTERIKAVAKGADIQAEYFRGETAQTTPAETPEQPADIEEPDHLAQAS